MVHRRLNQSAPLAHLGLVRWLFGIIAIVLIAQLKMIILGHEVGCEIVLLLLALVLTVVETSGRAQLKTEISTLDIYGMAQFRNYFLYSIQGVSPNAGQKFSAKTKQRTVNGCIPC